MKKIFLSLALIAQSLFSFSNESELLIKSTIKKVTVFLQGAELTRIGNGNLPIGQTEVVLPGLSPYINQNSIQAKGEGDFVILGVQYRQNYLNQQPKTKEILELEDSLEELQFKLEGLKNQRNVYENEESFFLANKNIGGSNVGVSGAELEKIANILRIRLLDLKSKQLELKNSEKKINEKVVRLTNQLNLLNSQRNRNTGEIVINVAAKNIGNARFTVSYLVGNAGWIPFYDIRANDSKSPVQLICRANVTQNTGEDWDNVKLSLSTGNPSLSGTQPKIALWWLNFHNPVSSNSHMYKNNSQKRSEAPSSAPSMSRDEKISNIKEAESMSSYTVVQENTTNYEYEISIPYNIRSGGKETSVEIQTYNVEALYKYYCAPRLDKDAFLLAKIVNWDQYNLMPGDANIYFEGTYVGKSFLNPMSTNDTLDISLGRDKSVTVSRTLIKDFSEKKIVGMNKKETFMYEINIRNKKKSDIEIDIEDQFPLSKNSEIEVDVLETSSGNYNKESGKLSWNFKIAPTQTKSVKFGYSVKYPKDKIIQGL